MRHKIIAANWKMNLTHREARPYLDALLAELGELSPIEVVLIPPFTAIPALAEALTKSESVKLYDPYIRTFWQIRNCLEFLQLVNSLTPEGEEVQVVLVTQSDRELCVQQDENLKQLVETTGGSKVTFSFDYDSRPTFHARSIQTDTGWKISLDRGLDLFQRYDMNALSLAAADQTERLTKGCEITYLLEKAEK